MILVTGSGGLIGTALVPQLRARGYEVREFDIARSCGEDTCDPEAVRVALEGVEGVVHLAAVSRVVWAERNPQLAEAVNVQAMKSLLGNLTNRKPAPWIVFASSREVYGEPRQLPVAEVAPMAPLNVYARSKVAGEDLINEARKAGIVANIVRFSNVYGCARDHGDRVVPAFARSAARGGILRLEGAENTFDFTHVHDVARGLAMHIEATAAGELLPPVHFVTGVGTTLQQLAAIAAQTSDHRLEVVIAPSRNYDVARFVGDPQRARELLGWESSIGIEGGFEMLTRAFGDREFALPSSSEAQLRAAING